MSIFHSVRGALGGKVPLYLYNTLTNKADVFKLPLGARRVRMYNCGPTVYSVQHIGNLSMFVFTDVLRRTLEYNGYDVKQVINITDVGHLTSDADEGEDKMSRGLRDAGMSLTLENMRILAEKYTGTFIEDLKKLNIDISCIEFPRASDYIPAQIAMIQTLEEKGYAYKASDGVYFDTARFPAYGALGNVHLEGLKEGARVAVANGKRRATDFALWKLDADLGWESPWGRGFPGWHIECSAMIRALLGQQIDIHTGGIEHIPVHHNNEIAQSECATGKHPLSRFWLHRAHLQLEGGKLAKSEGRVVYLSDVIERGFHPLALRYLFLTSHYRTTTNFTWEALGAAHSALARLISLRLSLGDAKAEVPSAWRGRFTKFVNEDLNTPGALAVLWDMTKDVGLGKEELLAGLLDFDRVLGLNLAEPDEKIRALAGAAIEESALPAEVRSLVAEREAARGVRDFAKADSLRSEIASLGYTVEDGENGPRVSKTR